MAHSRGVVHRDITPENVMIGEFGEVYLCGGGPAYSPQRDAPARPDGVDTSRTRRFAYRILERNART